MVAQRMDIFEIAEENDVIANATMTTVYRESDFDAVRGPDDRVYSDPEQLAIGDMLLNGNGHYLVIDNLSMITVNGINMFAAFYNLHRGDKITTGHISVSALMALIRLGQWQRA